VRERGRNAHRPRGRRGSGILGPASNNNLAFPFFSLSLFRGALAGVLLDLIRSRNFAVRRASLITPAVHRDSQLPSIRVSLLLRVPLLTPSSTVCPCHGKCASFGKVASDGHVRKRLVAHSRLNGKYETMMKTSYNTKISEVSVTCPSIQSEIPLRLICKFRQCKKHLDKNNEFLRYTFLILNFKT